LCIFVDPTQHGGLDDVGCQSPPFDAFDAVKMVLAISY
jgi:hypothetical protein